MMVMVTALQNGSIVERGTKRFGSADGWQQAQVDFANIVGTTVIVITGSRKPHKGVTYFPVGTSSATELAAPAGAHR
jgi:hypothetical protein